MDIDSQQRGRGQNKHYWTVEEDNALINALVELSTNPVWRAENGFRSGYLGQLERMMKEKIPTSTLKAFPNIESRVKLFRSKTTAIADILQISGFTWNYDKCTVECEKSAYDEYVKNHKEASGLYRKSFPFFNDLVAVFARDRAQGSARGDIGDDAEQYSHENITLDDNSGFFQTPTDEFYMHVEEPNTAPSPIGSETSSPRRRRNRKSTMDTSIEKLNQNFENFAELIGPGFKTLAEGASREAARDEAIEARAKARDAALAEIQRRKELLPQVIFEIDGLSDDEAMFILQVLPNDADQLKIFLELPNDKKLRFCRVLLSRLGFKPPNM